MVGLWHRGGATAGLVLCAFRSAEAQEMRPSSLRFPWLKKHLYIYIYKDMRFINQEMYTNGVYIYIYI